MEEFPEEEAELTVRADESSSDLPAEGSPAEADRAVRLEERGILEALSGL